jgi:hypothetical protein
MPTPDRHPADGDAEPRAGFSRRVVVVFAVQLVTLAALYWFGRHFA